MEQSMGFLTIIPPIVVVVMAIRTKNVLLSLVLGVALGLFLLTAGGGQGVLDSILGIIPQGTGIMAGVISDVDNTHLLMFIALLGGLIGVLTAAGCAGAFSEFAVKRIKNRVHAQLATLLLGCVIFIDDYFNAITVGNVMVPITDKFKISRAKLAYIIDSTSAPVTILMPVSSWVATVISLVVPAMAAYGFADSGMSAFLHACAYNYYAWLTLLMVLLVVVFKVDMGPMAEFERDVLETGKDSTIFVDVNEGVIEDMADGRKGTAFDMIFLITALVLFSVVYMIHNGGYFTGAVCLSTAFMECDIMLALVYGVLTTLLLAFVMLVPFGKMSLKQFDIAFLQGVKSMVTVVCILVLSWSFSVILGDEGLGTGRYVANAVGGWLPGWLMPAVLFAVTAFISFTTGASWGAMTIMLPTSIAICAAIDPGAIYPVMGATLAGTVFGDHCSPVSDTTVMSSSGAGCKHLDHVMSQIPYAILVAGISVLAYLTVGLLRRAWLGIAVGVGASLLSVWILKQKGRGKE